MTIISSAHFISLIFGVLISICLPLSIWLYPLYRKLSENEKEIRLNENKIDAVEPSVAASTASALMVEDTRQKICENLNRPLLRKRERLIQERQFIIDKLPFYKK